ncbi:Regulator of microtubule dynamics protein 1 [Aphelenchoides fujianensis]|nr:Regulator of microtubule dynamics protein 1 [Aphelenchoides fujianensis]
MLTGGGTATSLSLSFFGGGGTAATKKEADAKSVVKEADAFYNQYMIDNAYGVLRRHRQSEDPEILWRLARVVYEQAKISANADEKKRLAAEALDFAKRALSHSSQSGSFGANKWYAITLNYASELGGSKEQLGKTLDVKRHLERAIELNPLDATTWMILGIWHFSFADLPAYMRLVAKAIYGTPPSSTHEEALRHFERAETVQPQFCSTNNFYLGRTYEALGRKDDAIKQYKAAFLAPMISVDDRDIHTKRLKKLGIDANKL